MIKFRIEDDLHMVYAGSRYAEPLANKIGVPIDKLNFLIAQLAALLLAIVYRYYFTNKTTSPNLRYLAVLVPGFLLGYFEFGYQIWNLWILAMINYILMLKCNPKIVQDIVLCISIFYLSYLHLRRQINSYGSYIVDITVPTMIAVQKITSLAYSVHDGLSNEKLLPDQHRYAVSEVPSLLQYFSYIFQFPTLLSGPMFYFNDFVGFIEGTTEKEYLISQKDKKLPSYKIVAIQKLSISFIFLLLLLFVEPLFPINKLYDDKFLNNSSIIGIMFYIFLSTTCQRFKYYHAWKFGETIAITSGFGLVKNDSNEYQYISSIDIFGYEFANSFRNSLIAWNITTQDWLRRVSYDRAKNNKVLRTYVLSAVWHGFYPGYYLTFLSGAIVTNASRVARKNIRPYFQSNRTMKFIYDIITFIMTKVILTYIVFPFVILELWPSYRIYSRLYFSGHILLILFSIYPMIMNRKSSTQLKQKPN